MIRAVARQPDTKSSRRCFARFTRAFLSASGSGFPSLRVNRNTAVTALPKSSPATGQDAHHSMISCKPTQEVSGTGTPSQTNTARIGNGGQMPFTSQKQACQAKISSAAPRNPRIAAIHNPTRPTARSSAARRRRSSSVRSISTTIPPGHCPSHGTSEGVCEARTYWTVGATSPSITSAGIAMFMAKRRDSSTLWVSAGS